MSESMTSQVRQPCPVHPRHFPESLAATAAIGVSRRHPGNRGTDSPIRRLPAADSSRTLLAFPHGCSGRARIRTEWNSEPDTAADAPITQRSVRSCRLPAVPGLSPEDARMRPLWSCLIATALLMSAGCAASRHPRRTSPPPSAARIAPLTNRSEYEADPTPREFAPGSEADSREVPEIIPDREPDRGDRPNSPVPNVP
jgi:hypothetical protein